MRHVPSLVLALVLVAAPAGAQHVPAPAGAARAAMASITPAAPAFAPSLAKKRTRNQAIVRGMSRGAVVGMGAGLAAFVTSILLKEMNPDDKVDPTAGTVWVVSGTAGGAVVGALVARHRWDARARAEREIR